MASVRANREAKQLPTRGQSYMVKQVLIEESSTVDSSLLAKLIQASLTSFILRIKEFMKWPLPGRSATHMPDIVPVA